MIKIYKYGEVSNSEIFARDNISPDVEGVVSGIIADVARRGDEALFEYTKKSYSSSEKNLSTLDKIVSGEKGTIMLLGTFFIYSCFQCF